MFTNKQSKTAIFIILLSLVIFLFLIPIFSTDTISQNKEDKLIKHNGLSEDIFRDGKSGAFKSIYYSGAVNIPYNNQFIPFSDYLNYTEDSSGITWKTLDGKELKFEYFNKEKNKDKEDFKNKTDKKNLKTSVKKNRGNLYYNITHEKTANEEEFGFLLNTTDNIVSYEYGFIWNNLKFDFSQAIKEQNLSFNLTEITKNKTQGNITISEKFKEITFKGGDLSWIDPSVSYDANSASFKAYEDSTANYPLTNTLPPDGSTEHTSSEYTSIKNSDDSRDATATPDGGGATTEAGYVFFNMTFSEDGILSLNWSWEGYFDDSSGTPADNNNASLYLWNFTSAVWYRCNFNDVTDGSSDVTRNCNVSNTTGKVSDFYSGNKNTYLLVYGVDPPDAGDGLGNNIYTDYVSLSVDYWDLIINSPTNNQEILNNLSTILNTSQAGYNETVWYTWNNGISNNTLCTDSLECEGTITFPRQSYYNLTVYGNKSDGTQTSKSVTNLFVGGTCYQEFANVSTACGGLNTGSYTVGYDNWNEDNATYDGNWTTSGYLTAYGPDGIIFVNYTKPNAVNTSKILFKSNTTYANYSFADQTCWNYDPNKLVLMLNVTGILFDKLGNALQCYNGTRWNYIYQSSLDWHPDQPLIYEEGMYWNSYSSNTQLSLTNTLSNNSNFSTSTVNFTFNISDDNDYIKNISIYIDGILNKTSYQNYWINNSINTTLNFSITNIPNGTYSWFIRAFDSNGIIGNSSNFTFTVDSIPPSLSITYPTDYQSFTVKTGININFSRSDSGVGLSKCWWSNSSGIFNYTINNVVSDNITVNESGDGIYAVNIWCNDTLNNLASGLIHYVISLTSPAITLDFPTNYKNLSINNPTLNSTATDANGISTCELWGNWSGSWAKNQTLTNVTSGSTTAWTPITLADGIYLWNTWCNDTTNALSWAGINFTFTIDTIKPNLTLSQPQNTTYTTTSLNINYTTKDLHLANCWYTINFGITNITLSNCNNISYTANQGNTPLFIYSNDSSNNINSSNVSFFVDSINPSIIINTTFLNSSFLNYNTSIKINLTISDTNLKECWYNDNNGANASFTCGDNLSLGLSEALHTINIFANDTLNNVNHTEKISFTTDVTYPIPNITSITTTADSQTFTFNINSSDINLARCWYNIYNSTNGIDPSTTANTSVICNTAGNSETVSAYGTYSLKLYSNDSAGNENSTNQSFTISRSIVGGGGGGAPAEQQTVVVLIKPEQITRIYTDLERAKLYKGILDYCSNNTYFGKCSKKEEGLNKLNSDLSNIYKVAVSPDELPLWVDQYQDQKLENVVLPKGDIALFSLVTAEVKLIEKEFRMLEQTLDRFFLMTGEEISEVTLGNRELQSCEVLSGEVGFTCSVSGSKATINYRPPEGLGFSFKSAVSKISYTDKEGNTTVQDVNFRIATLMGVTILSLFSLIGILGFIYRGNIKKRFKNLGKYV